MTASSVWDDPDLRAGGEFVKLEKVGDSVSGTINAIRTHRFDDGKVVPQILMTTDEGEEKTLTAGQVRLKAELAEQRPEAGDHLKVVYTQEEKRSGGKTLKHFTVEIGRGGASSGPASVAAAAAVEPKAAEIDPAAAAAALANLTEEQKKQLGIS